MTISVHNITIDGTIPPWNLPPGGSPWDAAAYEEDVRRNLIYVFTTPVGGAIIPQITRELRIVPFPWWHGYLGSERRADATPDSWNASLLRGATAYQCSGGEEPGTASPDLPTGTGVGSSSRIRYTPTDWYDPSRRMSGFVRVLPSPALGTPGTHSDEVLCHELAHAIRHMRGVSQCIPAGHGYTTFEEFCATQVANVYASCRVRPPRASYQEDWSREMMPDPFGIPTTAQRDERRWIERMRDQQPGFCYALSLIPASIALYNPFREPPPNIRYA